MAFDWRILFRSEKGKLRPTSVNDVELKEDPASHINPDLEQVQDILSLRLMRNVVESARISSATRESVAEQVALLQSAGS